MTDDMHQWAKDLWPICRSITGPGVRETLRYLQDLIPSLHIHSVPTGYQAFDWNVPQEWSIRDAYIADLEGRRVIDFRDCNLHVLGYSTPVDAVLTRDELEKHLYSLPDQPDAIPYVTSYYAERWGFCLSEVQRSNLTEDRYRTVIDSSLTDGVLNYADAIFPGASKEEIFISTYVCHPSMANNELSGPVVAAALARWISALPSRKYTYRFAFIPETIGSLVYLSKHLDQMRERTVAGYVITCVGDERQWSFLPSRHGDTLADRAALAVLSSREFRKYSFLDRGSDERQYCSPNVDLPVASIMRTKYADYPEYHTSKDDLNLVTREGLEGSLVAYQQCILAIENNNKWRLTTYGEPQLGKRGLYPTISRVGSAADEAQRRMNFLAHCDGESDLIEVSEKIGVPIADCIEMAELFQSYGLIEGVLSPITPSITPASSPPTP